MENDFYDDDESDAGPFSPEEQEQQLATSKILDQSVAVIYSVLELEKMSHLELAELLKSQK